MKYVPSEYMDINKIRGEFYAGVREFEDVPNFAKADLSFYFDYIDLDPTNFFKLPKTEKNNLAVTRYALEKLYSAISIDNLIFFLKLDIDFELAAIYVTILKDILSHRTALSMDEWESILVYDFNLQ